MPNKGFIYGAAGLAAVFAWAFAGTAGAAPLQKIGAGEGVVDIVAWPGYIERGDTDPAYDWVTGFEQKTGCQVRIKTAGTSDEMVALMNEGGFDLVTASGDASLRLIAGKRVQEVNTDPVRAARPRGGAMARGAASTPPDRGRRGGRAHPLRGRGLGSGGADFIAGNRRSIETLWSKWRFPLVAPHLLDLAS